MARINLKYVNSFSNTARRNAAVRYYFRMRGMKAIPLPGIPGSEEFMTAYAMALAGLPDAPKLDIGAKRIEKCGTRHAALRPSAFCMARAA